MPKRINKALLVYVLFAVILLVVPTFVGGDAYLLNKFSRYLALGILAVALSLSWGYGGILNLGQGVTFGIGAYGIAMYLKLAASASNPGGLPDFMGWNNVSSLPWFWQPFHHLSFALLAGIGIPVLVAIVLGWFMFRARIVGVFVAIITLAMLVVTNLLFIDQQRYTGGFNGMTNLAILKVGPVSLDPYSLTFYYFASGLLIVILLAGFYIVNSKFGLVLRAIKENPDRVRFLGYDVAIYQTVAFAISGAMAAAAGMLYAMVLQFASPTFMGVALSLSVVIWCAVGGRDSLLAAAIGAILVNALQGTLSNQFLDTAQLLLGAVFVLVVLFLPRGLAGISEVFARKAKRSAPAVVAGAQATGRLKPEAPDRKPGKHAEVR